MKNYKFYTITLLLFTISSLASCINGKKETSTNNKVAIAKTVQENPIKRVESKEFNTEIGKKGIQLVDVRTPKEFKQGHIVNAINHNVYDADFIKKMATYKKDQPIYVYCRSGGRSMKAAKMLKEKGFNVVNLNGGISGWTRAGFKVVK